MKKIFTILMLAALSMSMMAQTQKVALLEPRIGEGSTEVTGMEKAMVRGELRKAIVNMSGYEAITRGDIDQMMKEQDFQRTGMVSNDQIKRMGEMSGADYICVSTLTKSNTEFYLEAYLIKLETGKMSNPASQYGELVNGKLANMLPVCETLAKELLGMDVTPSYSTSKAQTQTTKSPATTQQQKVAQKQTYQENSNLPPDAKEYNVYAYGVFGVIGYFANTEYDGAVVEYRFIYDEQRTATPFTYLGTAPFAYVNQKAYENPLLNSIKGIMTVRTLVVPNAKEAKIEFRLSKTGYNTVVVKPIYDIIMGGGPVLMIPMNKLKR